MEQRLLVDDDSEVVYIDYRDESMMKDIQNLVSGDLSEPYSIFTYRYFLHNYPELCICAYKTHSLVEPLDVGIDKVMIATIVCKLERESSGQLQGYMAMLAVDKSYRNRGIGRTLVTKVIERMIRKGCTEILLETEVSNSGALGLYTKLGFMKMEKMARYYLNGGDAYRLMLFVDQKGSDDEASSTQHGATELSISTNSIVT